MKFERLGDITKNLDSRRIPLNSEQRIAKSKKGLYPYIGANNIVGYIDEYIFDEKILCVAEDGGSWGTNQTCAVIYEGKTWVNNHAHVLIENGKANLDFLRCYLNLTNLNKHIKGATRGKLNKSVLENILVPLPSLSDQIQIANILSKAENLIAQRKESIRLLDEFLKSTFAEMFGSLFVVQNEIYQTINSCCNFIDYRGKTLERVPSGVPYITAKCVRQSYFDMSRIDYITEKSYQNVMTRGYPRPNDVLFTTEGATMGFVCRIPREFTNIFSVGQRIITLQCKEALTPEFLEFTLNNKEIQKQVFKRSSGSAAIGIRAAEFGEIKIPVPPIELQTQFTQIVEKTEALKSQYQQSLQELENLYGSLSQKAFKGELKMNENA